MPQLAVDLNTALVGLNDGLGQGQAQTDALGVLGEPAAVKPFENMVQVLWMDAAARILYGDRGQAGGLPPPDQDTVPLAGVVQGVFQQISNGLRHPYSVTKEAGPLVPLQADLLSLQFRPEGILPPDMLQQLRKVLR